jgi:hypothetical protein
MTAPQNKLARIRFIDFLHTMTRDLIPGKKGGEIIDTRFVPVNEFGNRDEFGMQENTLCPEISAVIFRGCALSRLRFAFRGCALSRLRFAFLRLRGIALPLVQFVE